MDKMDLITRLSESDHSALEQLFKAHFKSLFLHVQPILVAHDSCQEAVQNTFIKLWEKRSQIQVNTNVQAYLKKMALNEALMILRGQKNHDDPMDINFSSMDTRLEQVLDERPTYPGLAQCIESLPEKIKETFKLYRLEGLTQVEIADYLNKAKKTIEAQLSRSLFLLRECLGIKKNKKNNS